MLNILNILLCIFVTIATLMYIGRAIVRLITKGAKRLWNGAPKQETPQPEKVYPSRNAYEVEKFINR